MKNDRILYILTDLIAKGVPAASLVILGVKLNPDDALIVSKIYVIQGFLVNVGTLGQGAVFARSLTHIKLRHNSFFLLFGPIVFGFYGFISADRAILFAAIGSIFQIIYNAIQAFNNVCGSQSRQRKNDLVFALCSFIVFFGIILLRGIGPYDKVISQIFGCAIILLFQSKKIIEICDYKLIKTRIVNIELLTIISTSFIQWVIFYADKIISQRLMDPKLAQSFFSYSLLCNILYTINLAMLKAFIRNLHNLTNNQTSDTGLILRKEAFLITILSITGFVLGSSVLRYLSFVIPFNLQVYMFITMVLMSLMVLQKTYIIQGSEKIETNIPLLTLLSSLSCLSILIPNMFFKIEHFQIFSILVILALYASLVYKQRILLLNK